MLPRVFRFHIRPTNPGVTGRHLHFFADLSDRLFDRVAQIAAAHVEGDGNVAAVAFPIDVVRAVLDLDGRELRQRHALSGGREQPHLLDGLLGVAVGLLIAHHHVVSLLPDQHLAHSVAADGGLHRVLYVGHVDSEARRLLAVDGEVEVGLAEIAQQLHVMHARDFLT